MITFLLSFKEYDILFPLGFVKHNLYCEPPTITDCLSMLHCLLICLVLNSNISSQVMGFAQNLVSEKKSGFLAASHNMPYKV